MNYGYARVSTIAQNLDRQLDEFHKIGLLDKDIYTDKESGKDFNRTNYKKLCRKLKPRDVLFAKKLRKSKKVTLSRFLRFEHSRNYIIKYIDKIKTTP